MLEPSEIRPLAAKMPFFGSRLRSLVPPLLVVVIIAVATASSWDLLGVSKVSEAPAPAIGALEESSQAAEGTSIPEVESAANQVTVERAGATPQGAAESGSVKVAEGPKAAEIKGILGWVNSQPLKIGGLLGKVVLVDFWTYTCVNCIRTFPYLRQWYEKYTDDGLMIIGVHTPEFSFEKEIQNVRKAAAQYGIRWPIALDNEYVTWEAYGNRFWPAKYLIDKDGIIRYTHFGEGAYGETESRIRELLEEAGAELTEGKSEMPDYQAMDPDFLKNPSVRPTRELFAAQVYLYLGERRGHGPPDEVVTYEDPGEHEKNLIYLQGSWHNSAESVRHARETNSYEDYLVLQYSAKSVNAVIRSEGDEAQPFKVLVKLDGENVKPSYGGEDLVIEKDGRSFLYVEDPRLYSIIQAPSYGTYELMLSSNSPHFSVVTITFGIYESGL